MTFLTAASYTLLALLALPVTLQILYTLSDVLALPKPAYYARCFASFTALLLCAAYGTIASALLNIVGYGGLGQYTTARAFKWTMLVFTGVWFDVEDEEDWLNRIRPAVFVGNHQTEMDVLFLGHVFPPYCSVTAKKSLQWVPFLGWFMALSKTVFIERKSREQAVAAFDKAAEQMHKNQQSVYIFPEGTRSYYDYPDLLPFKKGAFHLAVQAQVPIVPIVVANYSNVLDVRRKIFRAGTVPAKVLKPIETKGKTKESVDALMAEARGNMLEGLKGLTVQAIREGVALKEHERANGKAKSTGVDLGVATT